MGKISDNGGVYMTIITSDMIIYPRKQVNCYLRYQLKFIGLYLPEQDQTELDIQVDAKKDFIMFF